MMSIIWGGGQLAKSSQVPNVPKENNHEIRATFSCGHPDGQGWDEEGKDTLFESNLNKSGFMGVKRK